MASLESLQTKTYTAQSKSGRVVDDKAVAIEFVYVGSDATPVVTLVSNTGITLADGGYTTGSLAFATYTNLGLLADEINANHNLYWKARVLDGLRSSLTASSSLIPNSAITAVSRGGESIYEAFFDTSVIQGFYYRVSMDRGLLRDDNARLKTDIPLDGHRVKINQIKYNLNIDAAALNGVRVYEFDPIANTETQIWSAKSVDATTTTHDFGDYPITSGYGKELIVAVVDATSVTDDAANFLQVDFVRE